MLLQYWIENDVKTESTITIFLNSFLYSILLENYSTFWMAIRLM